MIGQGDRWRIAVRLLAAFALVFLSFAHKPSLVIGTNAALAAEYRLPDGSFAEICFGTEGVEHEDGKAPPIAPICEACRLAASVLLPEPPQASVSADKGNWLADSPVTEIQVALTPLRLLPPPRGPPILS
ncbi:MULTISPECIES: hypothetical protein [Sinorhizobium]|uniref:DUF2946 family protein n=1 Tax=Sinorhizobium americanum TaxID=194963 RepID=A0A2S3YNZ3_9HYPH|nr:MULTISPECIES: hypothetical protein [Sinorhizobium]ASY56569.1 hypothetical protein SS05631_c16360 [Sinorhizobium sp. CCBAU 05631]PDT42729.1 hypothetical protein CO656_03405 [Sinorhizobium sp. FG01]PDT54966.1 hypothetical protein CO664_07785 [Sinorhizobium sp. NG07B]POH32010.1 hypothetical protein ATY30_11435 [Sinorhizobium americanum]POH32654.1 hypothetical protein ATY31_12065 [Sinorhizobium americanum]